MSYKTHCTISCSYDFQAHLQRCQRRCCVTQIALLRFEVLPELSPALPRAPRHVVGTPSYSEGRQECPPSVWYSPEIYASKFTLHILSDTPAGFQWLKWVLLKLSAATVGIWRVNSIYENFLQTSQLPSVYQFYIPSGPMKPTGTGISKGYVHKMSRLIDIHIFGRCQEAFGDPLDSRQFMVVNIL